jgi:hypothetical protein
MLQTSYAIDQGLRTSNTIFWNSYIFFWVAVKYGWVNLWLVLNKVTKVNQKAI